MYYLGAVVPITYGGMPYVHVSLNNGEILHRHAIVKKHTFFPDWSILLSEFAVSPLQAVSNFLSHLVSRLNNSLI